MRQHRFSDFNNMTQTAIAEAIGVERQTIGNWVKNFGCPRNENKRYSLKDVWNWREDFLETGNSTRGSGAAPSTKSQDFMDKWREERWLMIRMQRLQMEEYLVPDPEIKAAWAGRAAEFATGLALLENRIPPLAALKPQDEIRDILHKETTKIRDQYYRDGQFCDAKIAEKVLEIMYREGILDEIAEYVDDPDAYLEAQKQIDEEIKQEEKEFKMPDPEPEMEPEKPKKEPKKRKTTSKRVKSVAKKRVTRKRSAK